jgi:hypothetical protein
MMIRKNIPFELTASGFALGLSRDHREGVKPIMNYQIKNLQSDTHYFI